MGIVYKNFPHAKSGHTPPLCCNMDNTDNVFNPIVGIQVSVRALESALFTGLSACLCQPCVRHSLA